MMKIPKDYIKVYIAETDTMDDPAVYDRLYGMLPDFRKEKADSYKIAEVRNQSVAVFCLLIYGLEKVLITDDSESKHDRLEAWSSQDCEIQDLSILSSRDYQTADPDMWDALDYRTTETGKPYFAGRPDIHFSLSHTKGVVMCAISGSEVGCDIERIDRRMDLETVAARILTEEEIRCCRVNEMQHSSEIDPKEFFRIWTRKEAYSKYTGKGLSQIVERADLHNADINSFSGETPTHVWVVVFG